MSKHHRVEKSSFVYNPYEIAWVGPAGAGKSTLIQRLLERWNSSYRVAYVQRDPDSQKGAAEIQAMGKRVHVALGQEAETYLLAGPGSFPQSVNPLLSADFVLLEEQEQRGFPAIVFLTRDQPPVISNGEIIGLVGEANRAAGVPAGIVYLQRDDLDAIQSLVEAWLRQRAERLPLYGLVLVGGKSTRMQQDKATLCYHGEKSQVQYAVELLERFCQAVFVSCRQEQTALPLLRDFAQLHDTFLELGPLGGILSALREKPAAAWLVLACDLPWVDGEAIATLLAGRNPCKMATAYLSSDGLPDPLCAVYEPKSLAILLQGLAVGLNCPREIFLQADIQRLQPSKAQWLTNVNSPQEYAQARSLLKGEL